jgi:hypothetical protein
MLGGCQVLSGGAQLIGGTLQGAGQLIVNVGDGALRLVGLKKTPHIGMTITDKYSKKDRTWAAWINRTGGRAEGNRDRDDDQTFAQYIASQRNQGSQWAILLETFSGPTRQERVRERLEELREHTGMRRLWSVEHEETMYLYRGQYPKRNDLTAIRDLRRTHNTIFKGKRPYQEAKLVALNEKKAPNLAAEFDLRSFPGMYTLQIEIFTREMGKKYQTIAEERAAKLRKDGAKAYFYHGRRMSIVTIGLFDYQDAFVTGRTGQDQYAPEILKIQDKHPFHSANGKTIEERRGGRLTKQKSLLVKVPTS